MTKEELLAEIVVLQEKRARLSKLKGTKTLCAELSAQIEKLSTAIWRLPEEVAWRKEHGRKSW
jgi:hypothetical protein